MLGIGNNLIHAGVLDEEPILTTAGLQVWYQFNVGLTASGSNVASWKDSSPNENNLTQGTATNQPLKTSPGGGIHLDGTDNFMTLGTALDLTTFTAFAVIELDDTSLETLFGNGTDGSDFFRLNGSAWTIRTAGNSFQNNLGTGISTGDKRIVTLGTDVGASATTYDLELDGAAENTVSVDNQTFTIGDIGRNSADAQYFDGKIYEIVIYNTELTSAERAVIEKSIQGRNGL